MTVKNKVKKPLWAYFIPVRGDSVFVIVQKICLPIIIAWLGVVLFMLKGEYEKPKPDPVLIKNVSLLDNFAVEEVTPLTPVSKKKPTVLPEYKEWHDQNNDMVGWIKIDGTAVDYPVMQVKGFDGTINYNHIYKQNMIYLEQDFYKNYSFAGCITADYRAVFDKNRRPANALIYGHNLLNGTYFHDVRYYDIQEYGREFYDEHPTIQFDTIYEKGTYKIFAIMEQNTRKSEGEVFYYDIVYKFDKQKEFNDYYAKVLDRSFIYNPEVDLRYGDEVIVLSTCTFPFGKSISLRLVVYARRVRDGEDPTVDVSKTVINEDPLMYDYYYSVMGGKWGGRKWDPALIQGFRTKKA